MVLWLESQSLRLVALTAYIVIVLVFAVRYSSGGDTHTTESNLRKNSTANATLNPTISVAGNTTTKDAFLVTDSVIDIGSAENNVSESFELPDGFRLTVLDPAPRVGEKRVESLSKE